MTEKVHRLKSYTFNTRRNFPAHVARKRGESNFLRSFERAWFARHRGGMAAGEFSLERFGVADLVWISWNPVLGSEDFSAVSLEKQIARRSIFAFEAKLKDWRRALQQAFRYRYFADKSIVVMPHEHAGAAIENVEAFKHLSVGLWTLDRDRMAIHAHYTPTKVHAMNREARQKVVSLLSSKFHLRKLGEKV